MSRRKLNVGTVVTLFDSEDENRGSAQESNLKSVQELMSDEDDN